MKPRKKSKSVIVWATPADVRKMPKSGLCSIGPEKWYPTDRKYRLTRIK